MDREKDFKELKELVKTLAVECPMLDALPGCPLSALRDMPVAERPAAVEQMSMETLQQIVRFHSICMGARN